MCKCTINASNSAYKRLWGFGKFGKAQIRLALDGTAKTLEWCAEGEAGFASDWHFAADTLVPL